MYILPMSGEGQGAVNGESSPEPTHEELLAKLEEANRLLEADQKSFQSIVNSPSPVPTPTPTHSRQDSDASVKSAASSTSNYSTQTSEENETKVTPPKRSKSKKRNKSESEQQEALISASTTGNAWDIWGKLVNDWETAKKKPAVIKDLVRKGIPHHFRGLGWQLLLGVHDSPHKQLYVEYLKQTSPSEKLIRRDIARTFPDHDFFKEEDGLGQESLFNVMKAYSLHDREVGYCQGSGFIVGLLLMQMPEEEAFAVLVRLMQDYRLRELFKPSMAELGLCMYKLEAMIQELLPDLYLHFQSQGFHTSMYASSWFLTLFATSFSLSLACRVMDLFISEGMDVIFRIGLAVLQTSQDELISQDMEGMLKFFSKQLPVQYESDPEKLFSTAFSIRYSAKKMKKIEKEYTALKSKENEDQIELRRLRTENRLLRQRIENLEKESAALADRLIHDQVTRAQEAEETYALKNNLSATKQKLADTQKKLSDAEKLIGDIKTRTSSITSASSLDDGEAQVVIQGLQEELIALRLKDADTDTLVKELRMKIKDLEDTNTQLQRAPTNDVQHLQEELIAVKLREAEANLSLKEMRHRVNDLEEEWQKFRVKSSLDPLSPTDKNSNKTENRQLQDELMEVKIKEASCLSELKETKQKIMELETQNHICTNQIRRMDEENKSFKSQLEERDEIEKDLRGQIKELGRKLDDMETQRKSDSMLIRIKDAENAQMIAELKQRIAELEIQKEELLTADRLEAKDGSQDLANKIYDLQDEVLQLKLTQCSPIPKSPYRKNSPSDSEDDESDEELENPESLNRTLSEIIEGKRLGDPRSPTSLLTSSYNDIDSPLSPDSKDSAIGSECCASDKNSGSNGSFCDKLSDHSSVSEIITAESKTENISSDMLVNIGADQNSSDLNFPGKCANIDTKGDEIPSGEITQDELNKDKTEVSQSSS